MHAHQEQSDDEFEVLRPSSTSEAAIGHPAQDGSSTQDITQILQAHIDKRLDDIQNLTNKRFDDLETQFRQIVQGESSSVGAAQANSESLDRGFNRDSIEALQRSMNEQFDHMKEMFDRVDDKFNSVDAQFNRVDAQHNRIDGQFNHVDGRFNDLANHLNEIIRHMDALVKK